MTEDLDRENELHRQARWHRSLRWATMGLAVGLLATAAWAFWTSKQSAGTGGTAPPSSGGDVKTLGGESAGGVESGKMASPRAGALSSVAVARMEFESEKDGNFDHALAAIRAIDDESERDLGLLTLADMILPMENVENLAWHKYPYDDDITKEQRAELLRDIQRAVDLANLASPGAIKVELMLRAAYGKISLDKREQNSSSSETSVQSNDLIEAVTVDPKKLIEDAEAIAKSLPSRGNGLRLTWGLVFSSALAALSYICSQIGGPIMAVLGRRGAAFVARIVGTKKTETILNKDLQKTAEGP